MKQIEQTAQTRDQPRMANVHVSLEAGNSFSSKNAGPKPKDPITGKATIAMHFFKRRDRRATKIGLTTLRDSTSTLPQSIQHIIKGRRGERMPKKDEQPAEYLPHPQQYVNTQITSRLNITKTSGLFLGKGEMKQNPTSSKYSAYFHLPFLPLVRLSVRMNLQYRYHIYPINYTLPTRCRVSIVSASMKPPEMSACPVSLPSPQLFLIAPSELVVAGFHVRLISVAARCSQT